MKAKERELKRMRVCVTKSTHFISNNFALVLKKIDQLRHTLSMRQNAVLGVTVSEDVSEGDSGGGRVGVGVGVCVPVCDGYESTRLFAGVSVCV